MMSRRRKILLGFILLLLVIGCLGFVFHPSRPLWMKHETFDVPSVDGVRLSGTLSLPRWKKPVGGVVVVHGSGPLTRDHLRGDVRSLVSLGFAVVHYDKRGAGQSQGTYMPSASTPMNDIVSVLAHDAAAMLDQLRQRLDGAPIDCGFFGASQAGWIIPVAATRCRQRPDFLVILSGTPASTGMEGFYSTLTGDGTGPPQLEDRDRIREQTLAFDGEPGFDPMPTWQALSCPTLWLLGEADESVPTFASLAILNNHIASGHSEHHVVCYPEVGHDLRNVTNGQAAEIWPTLWNWYLGRTEKSTTPDNRP